MPRAIEVPGGPGDGLLPSDFARGKFVRTAWDREWPWASNWKGIMDESVEISVDAAPPAKDGALFVRNPDHPQHRLVVALREAMRRVMDERECAGDSSDSGLETGVGHPHPALSQRERVFDVAISGTWPVRCGPTFRSAFAQFQAAYVVRWPARSTALKASFCLQRIDQISVTLARRALAQPA